MQQPQKTDKSGYRQKNTVEQERYDGACSTSNGEMRNQDGANLLERIIDRRNLNLAYKRIFDNKGSAGVDGLTVEEMLPYLKEHKQELITSLINGTYKPKPVLRVEIPKPDGGKRKLGIPTVVDRMIQQAISQVLTPIFDPTFSETSFGFRPNRNCHQAIRRAREYYKEGYKYVVDIDMKQYFDTVNHDKLMYFIERKVKDKRVLKLIRRFLMSGIMDKGLFNKSDKGTPQGGNLSPLLSNIYLDEFDKMLEERGHKFIRYADDCNIYVKSKRAGERVMKSCTKFLEGKLKLTVNQEKSEVGSPLKLKFLGFCLWVHKGKVKIRTHKKPKQRIKEKLKKLTQRNRGVSVELIFEQLRRLMIGWIGYYGIAEMRSFISDLNGWLRRRIRQYMWKQWKTPRKRKEVLISLGIDEIQATRWSSTRKGFWRISRSQVLNKSLTDNRLAKLGYVDILQLYEKRHSSY